MNDYYSAVLLQSFQPSTSNTRSSDVIEKLHNPSYNLQILLHVLLLLYSIIHTFITIQYMHL